MGYVSFAMVEYLFSCHLVMLQTFNLDYCNNLFSKFFIGDTNNLGILYSIHFEQKVFDLFWIDIFASSDDHIFFSSNDR